MIKGFKSLCPATVLILLCTVTLAQDTQPPVVSTPVGQPPSDAIVLFDGTDLDEWTTTEGDPAHWIVSDGVMTVQRGGILTKRYFGDCQLHLEFSTPNPPVGEDQDRGNSGIYFHSAYEVQVLDSYQSETYTHGMLGAVYEQYSPLVNAARPPGEWQTYDIIFHAGRFNEHGTMVERPRVTVLLNGVLVQDNVEITGPSRASIRRTNEPTGPLYLQDHNHPVRYRNIWLREL